MQSSRRSCPKYLPRFPRLQLRQLRRRTDEALAFVDSDYRVHVRPNRTAARLH